MKKSLGIIIAGISYLSFTPFVFAANITLTPPSGSIAGLCLTLIPQFLIQLVFIIGVVASIIFLIYGGIKWILSGGDKTAVEAARNHIVAALVGLVIVVGAFFIIGFIFQLLGQKNPVTNLTINDVAGVAITCP